MIMIMITTDLQRTKGFGFPQRSQGGEGGEAATWLPPPGQLHYGDGDDGDFNDGDTGYDDDDDNGHKDYKAMYDKMIPTTNIMKISSILSLAGLIMMHDDN